MANINSEIDSQIMDFIKKVNQHTDKYKIRDQIRKVKDINYQNSEGNTFLMIAILKNIYELFEIILEFFPNPNIQNKKGDTALTLATKMDNYHMVRELLNNGSNPDIQNINGETALSISKARNKNMYISFITDYYKYKSQLDKFIADYNAIDKIKINMKINDYLYNILEISIKQRNINILKMYLQKEGDPNIKLQRGREDYSLLNVADKYNDIESAKLLLENGAKPNCNIFLCRNNIEMTKLFLKYGADPNCKLMNNNTSLTYTQSTNDLEMAELLLQNGANPDHREEYPELYQSIAFGRWDFMKLLIRYGANIFKTENSPWNNYEAPMTLWDCIKMKYGRTADYIGAMIREEYEKYWSNLNKSLEESEEILGIQIFDDVKGLILSSHGTKRDINDFFK